MADAMEHEVSQALRSEHEESPIIRVALALESIAGSLLRLAHPPLMVSDAILREVDESMPGNIGRAVPQRRVFTGSNPIPDSQAIHDLGKRV